MQGHLRYRHIDIRRTRSGAPAGRTKCIRYVVSGKRGFRDGIERDGKALWLLRFWLVGVTGASRAADLRIAVVVVYCRFGFFNDDAAGIVTCSRVDGFNLRCRVLTACDIAAAVFGWHRIQAKAFFLIGCERWNRISRKRLIGFDQVRCDAVIVKLRCGIVQIGISCFNRHNARFDTVRTTYSVARSAASDSISVGSAKNLAVRRSADKTSILPAAQINGMIQIADLIARQIGRQILKPEQQNRAYEIIEKKFRRNSKGIMNSWDLKLFP